MKILLSSGGAFWGVTIVAVILLLWFGYNYIKVRNAGYVIDAKQGDGKGMTSDPTKVKAKENAFLFYFAAIVMAYIIALVVIYNDYKPAKPHTVTPLEDGRTPAGE